MTLSTAGDPLFCGRRASPLRPETGNLLHNRCGLLVLGATLRHASHVPAGFLDTTIEAASNTRWAGSRFLSTTIEL